MLKKYLKTLFLLFWIFLAIFSSRWVFYEKFDKEYLLDLYHNSQWFVPLSDRIIADDLYYMVSAIKINENASIYSINPETPPLGKYLYAFAISSTGNPYYLAAVLYLLSVAVFYYLSRLYFKDKNKTFLTSLIFATNPLFIFQIQQSMLDLPLLFFFLLFLLFKLLYFINHKNKYLLASAISLGFLSACKFPLFTPIIIFISLIFLLFKKKYKASAIFLLVSFFSYAAAHATYFLQGNSFISWAKTQKWMLDFYLKQYSEKNPVSTLFQLLSGWLNTPDSAWQFSQEWTILWPIFIVLILYYLFRIVQQRKFLFNFNNYLLMLLGSFYFLFIFASFTARYLLIALPVGILLLLRLNLSKKFLYLLTSILLIQTLIFIRRSPEKMLFFASEKWERGHYQDFYYFFDTASKSKKTWAQFHQDQKQSQEKNEISFSYPKIYPWTNKIKATAKFQKQTKEILILREKGAWRIHWD